jgi:hypothetical protein
VKIHEVREFEEPTSSTKVLSNNHLKRKIKGKERHNQNIKNNNS